MLLGLINLFVYVYFLVTLLHRLLNTTANTITTPAPHVISQNFFEDVYNGRGSVSAVSVRSERFGPAFFNTLTLFSTNFFCNKKLTFIMIPINTHHFGVLPHVLSAVQCSHTLWCHFVFVFLYVLNQTEDYCKVVHVKYVANTRLMFTVTHLCCFRVQTHYRNWKYLQHTFDLELHQFSH